MKTGKKILYKIAIYIDIAILILSVIATTIISFMNYRMTELEIIVEYPIPSLTAIISAALLPVMMYINDKIER